MDAANAARADALSSNREPDGAHPTKCRSDDPDDVRRYNAERKRKSREKAEKAAIEANKAQRDEWREMRKGNDGPSDQ